MERKGVIALVLVVIFAVLSFTAYYNDAIVKNIAAISKRRLEARKLEDAHHDLHHKIYHHNGTEHRNHWKVLETVDGLKNEDVSVFITSTSVRDGVYLRERIIPSARTWMRLFANTFVIVEDTFEVRYSMRHCEIQETTHYTSFACHNEPTYVLSRLCTNEYYGGDGPCCKVDDMINYLVNDRPDFFAHTKFVLHADDDTYWRADQVMRWLASIENSGVNHFPITANHHGNEQDNGGVWHINECKEIIANGWYQPLMFNHAALERLAVGSKDYGLKATCKSFDVTHDVGVGVYVWLYQLFHVQMPLVEINGNHEGKKMLKPGYMVVHGVRHIDEDNCGDSTKWPANLRYNQKVATGCGDIENPGPFHNVDHDVDMYDVWVYFRDHGEPVTFGHEGVNGYIKGKVIYDDRTSPVTGKKEIKKVITAKEYDQIKDNKFDGNAVTDGVMIPELVYLRGYDTTKHFKEHKLLEKFVPFAPADCNKPGSFQH